jgi:hypothetical protein
MGLFGNRAARAARKAEAAQAAAVDSADSGRTPSRRERRERSKVAKAQISALKAQENVSVKLAEKAAKDKFSVAAVKKYLGVARVLIPVLAPLAYRGATFLRGQLDNRRARQLGVGVEQLDDYSGHGGRLSARIASAENSATEVLKANATDTETAEFADATRARLASLSTAVQAAEQMPAARRKTAHNSIAAELSGIEADLLARLGVE